MADIKLDPANVPPELHALIPYAEKWGIRDKEQQDALLSEASLEELEELYTAVQPALDPIVGFVIAYTSLDKPGSEDVAIFDALWRAWREASHTLNNALSRKQLLKLVGYPEKFTAPKLDPSQFPVELHPLIPHAEKWVLDDDLIRFYALEEASTEQLEELVQAVNMIGRDRIRLLTLDMVDKQPQDENAYILMKLIELEERAEFLLRTHNNKAT